MLQPDVVGPIGAHSTYDSTHPVPDTGTDAENRRPEPTKEEGPMRTVRRLTLAAILLGGLLAIGSAMTAEHHEAAENPCAAANPCAAKNPCAENPCAAKNPCAENPCAAANPCAGE